ncbi:MAG: tRNA 2-thiouridine(34) synthase MnmA [Candidatus Krumholzibacteriota bacterium]|nr:tRNA 2-thiouridine(34) synthase MnmA [Candidatus Krumholzibacteriota bacterium]
MRSSKLEEKVVVGMSGGVDSTIAALSLLRQGYSVTGVTFRFFGAVNSVLNDKDREAVTRAAHICRRFDIPHIAVEVGGDFKDRVVRRFVDFYRSGRTPNPCIGCNEYIKFPYLAEAADSVGAKWISTGHYARVINYKNRKFLSAARDNLKDQSYFLYRVPVKYLQRTIFPLGDKLKSEVRETAREYGLTGSTGRESQDVCFIPEKEFNTFLEKEADPTPGDVVDSEGQTLGRHRGICFYTVGQRKGLGISASQPLYVKNIDPRTGRITLAENEAIYTKKAVCESVILRARELELPLKAKIRFRHRAAVLEDVKLLNRKLIVSFHKEQRAVTPGQSLVIYKDGVVLGGGVLTDSRGAGN